MRTLLALVYIISFGSFACGSDVASEFRPFAVEVDNYKHLRSFMVYFPDNDMAENTMYLSNISATIKNDFILDLDSGISNDYPGYYSALINIKEELIDNLVIVGSYNHSDSAHTSLTFCANWKRFKLNKLLSNSVKNI